MHHRIHRARPILATALACVLLATGMAPASAASPAQAPPALSALASTAQFSTLLDPPATQQAARQMSQQAFTRANVVRATAGLPALQWNEALCEAAYTRATENTASISHTRPNGTDYHNLIASMGFVYGAAGRAGENIAIGYGSGTTAVDSWMQTDEHQANLLSAEFTHTAVAAVPTSNASAYEGGYTFVQLFFKGSSATAAAPSNTIELPSANGQNVVSAALQVKGYALSPSGINRVRFYVDNDQFLSEVTSLGARQDVVTSLGANAARYPHLPNCGYDVSLNISRLTAGSHTLHIEVISGNGYARRYDRTFSVTLPNPMAQTTIDAPAAGVNVTGNLSTSGWAVHRTGIKAVHVYLDGHADPMGAARSNRTDVNNAVNSTGRYYNGLNNGFSATIPRTWQKTGENTLNIAAIANDDTVQWIQRKFMVNAQPTSSVDSASAVRGGRTLVNGWALAASGVGSVHVYLQNTSTGTLYFAGSGNTGVGRGDVANAYNGSSTGSAPYYNATTSGFSLNLPTPSNLPAGTYTVHIPAFPNSGEGAFWGGTKTITVN
ncbi:hypothetical protein FACS189415_1460 [Bacteroidia bacterium]|nr:hypothetical protein FACS189415_1460 [Bacteroidia bacterium]